MSGEESPKIRALKEKQRKIANEIREERLRERRKQRRDQQRRLTLIGELTEHNIAAGKLSREGLLRMLDGFLERPADRELFGLAPRREG